MTIDPDIQKAAYGCLAGWTKTQQRANVERAIQAERNGSAERLREATELLNQLHHAVCGENGFASSVRFDSCRAYPWPALDIADEKARAFLAKEGK